MQRDLEAPLTELRHGKAIVPIRSLGFDEPAGEVPEEEAGTCPISRHIEPRQDLPCDREAGFKVAKHAA